MQDCAGCATGTENNGGGVSVELIANGRLQVGQKPDNIIIVGDDATILEDNRVGRADRAGAIADFVCQGQGRLLVRHRDAASAPAFVQMPAQGCLEVGPTEIGS